MGYTPNGYENEKNARRLKTGMSVTEVRDIMGSPQFTVWPDTGAFKMFYLYDAAPEHVSDVMIGFRSDTVVYIRNGE